MTGYFGSIYFGSTYFIASNSIPTTGPVFLPTSLDNLCLALKALLITREAAPANLVFYSDTDKPFMATGYPFLAIEQGSYRNNSNKYRGAGRWNTWSEGEVIVNVVGRAARDQAQRNEILLHGNPLTSPATPGLNLQVHQVINSLHGIFVIDAVGNQLTTEPAEWIDCGAPRTYDGNPEWTGIPIRFRVKYQMLLTLPE